MNVTSKAHQVQDKKFYQSCKNLLVAALKILKQHQDAGEPLPNVSEAFLGVLLDADKFRIELFFNKFEPEIKATHEFANSIECMKQNSILEKHIGKLVGTKETQIGYPAEGGYLRQFIINYAYIKGNFEFDESTFENQYSNMESFFYSDKFKLKTLVFLEHFSSDSDEILLTEDTKIIKLPQNELNNLQHVSVISDFALHLCKYAIQISSETEKIIGGNAMVDEPSQSIRKSAGDVVSALRVFKEGLFGFNHIRIDAGVWGPYGGMSYQPDIYKKYFWRGNDYALQKEEVDNFVEFWNKFNKKRKENFLDIALGRFNYSYERERFEDQLIDNMIAFESLFLGDSTQEARYRLSLRTAFFIGVNPEMRKQVFQDMLFAYDLRSKFVHGASQGEIDKLLKKHETNLPTFVAKIGGYLRCSIKKFIQMNRDLKQEAIMDELDNQILLKDIPPSSAAARASYFPL